MKILVSFTPSESKRLIARAVAALPEVVYAMEKARVLIANGTTTAYVAEELLRVRMEKWRFPSGLVTRGRPCRTPENRLRPFLIDKGQLQAWDLNISMYDELHNFISQFTAEDVFIKSANAVDTGGNAGFLLAHPSGGTIGMALGRIAAQGSHFIVPVGLEKMVASVPEAARSVPGIHKFSYSFGIGSGYLAVSNAKIITEIQALDLLTGAKATHLASGGVGGSEGAVTLAVSGDERQTKDAVELIKSVKGEEPLKGWKYPCAGCDFKCLFYKQDKSLHESK